MHALLIYRVVITRKVHISTTLKVQNLGVYDSLLNSFNCINIVDSNSDERMIVYISWQFLFFAYIQKKSNAQNLKLMEEYYVLYFLH
jgi:hypothetical protein